MKQLLFLSFFITFSFQNVLARNECYLIEQASFAVKNDDIQTAIARLETFQNKYPKSPYRFEVALKLGKLYFDNQEFQQAKQLLSMIDISERQVRHIKLIKQTF